MRYLSLCSGIEAASVAWSPLGWSAVGFSEIDRFPCAALAHHYPDTSNFGDMNLYGQWPDSLRPDLIVAGTPCQAFSVAGLRQGLADPRGNLSLVFLGVLDKYRPGWVVWENVPGVLSDKTGAFGALLGGLGELGYGFAYRVLDAPAAVLFERESLSGDSPPSRRKGEGSTYNVAPCLAASGRGVARTGETQGQDCVMAEVAEPIAMATGQGGAEIGIGIGTTLNCNHEAPIVAFSGRSRGDDGRGYDRPPLFFGGETVGAIDTVKPHCVAFNALQDPDSWQERTGPLDTDGSTQAVALNMQVRRLTPRECERLQGFPDDYTLIPYRGKAAADCADGPRYKALGNSMAVPVMRWIGEGIAAVNEWKTEGEKAS